MNICHIDETRSRITVSNINDVPLKWSATGCVNDRTQFGHSGARWSRSFVPNSEATIDIRNFEPQTGTYSVDRRSEEHTSELQSLMRISYAVFCLKKKTTQLQNNTQIATPNPTPP